MLVALVACHVEQPTEAEDPPRDDERTTSEVLEELGAARDATHPRKRLAQGGESGELSFGPLALEGSGEAEDASASAAYDESCDAVDHDDGTTVVTCRWDDGSDDGVLCTEVYDAAGELLSWTCEGYGSYVCVYDAGASCTYDDGQGFTCTDVYDEAWAVVSSDCPWAEETSTPGYEEQCTANDDGTLSCSYADPEWSCEYVFSADGASLLSAACSGVYGSVDCLRDDVGLACAYAYDGFPACTEVYADNAYYGLLSSDCDWNADGTPDCTSLAAGGVSCVWDDGSMQCEYAFAEGGRFDHQSCSHDGGTWDCLSTEVDVQCTATFEGGSCNEIYDLELNLVESTCR